MTKRKLSSFDFDGTLVDTGVPETHMPIWKEKTGTDWPHKGWWGRKESLDMTVFDFETKPDVIADYNREGSEDTLRIMLTGRRPKLKNEVKAILDSKGLVFDDYLFNYGSDTLDNKIEQLNKILTYNPEIVEVELWDDRLGHFDSFESWGADLLTSGRLKEFKLNRVHNPQWTK